MKFFKQFDLSDPECKVTLQKSELIISTIAINILSLALPIMVLQIYDRIMTNKSTGTLAVLGFGVCVAAILEGILRMTRKYIVSYTGMVYEYSLAANAMRRYIDADPAKLAKEGAGKQMQNLNAFGKLRDFFSGQAFVSLIDIPFMFFFLFIIGYLTGLLVLVPLVLIVIFSYITWRMGEKLVEALKQQDETDDARYNFIVETLHGIHSVKSYGIEALFQRRYERLEEQSSLNNYETALISTTSYSLAAFFNEIMVISVVSFGAPLVIDNQLTTGALVATILLSGRLMQPLQKALALWSQFQDFRIAYEKAQKMFSIEQIRRESYADSAPRLGQLKIRNLSFSYGEKQIFSDINLELKMPEVIAIHGANDSGKSTLLRLIAGISEPTKGNILIDGIPASKYSSEKIVEHVALISQENTMFQGTIMENLTAFDEDKEARAMELAKLLRVDKDVALLPQGYDTKVNDGFADTIAPGVKQRIAIVRVLLNKPKIILFNAADKGLDKEGYNYLVKLLNMLKGKVAMIVSTDDHNINNLADKHYLLKDGKLNKTEFEDASSFAVKPYKELRL